jgi:hypothetical protein
VRSAELQNTVIESHRFFDQLPLMQAGSEPRSTGIVHSAGNRI